MVETVRWVRERKRGATNGGERLHLERDGVLKSAQKLARDEHEYTGDYVAYAVMADDDADWYSISFTANQNNRNYTLGRYKHGDFPSQLPDSWSADEFPDRREWLEHDEVDYSELLDKVDQTRLFNQREEEIRDLHPEIRRLADRCDPDFTQPSPSVKQALDRPERFFLSAALLGGGGTRSLGNIKKAFQQAYEIEAIRDAYGLEVKQGDLSRRWQTGGLPPGEIDLEVSRDVRKQLGIGFGRPNFVLKGEKTYSIWLEFPFNKYTRPDLFVVRGEHDSAFNESVRGYLNNFDEGFYQDVLDEWRSGFMEGLVLGDHEGIEAGSTSPEDIAEFATGLSKHLKHGVVIESKEESGEEEEAEEQIEAYNNIFTQQETLLLTWFSWTGRTPGGVEVVDNFDTHHKSAQEFAETVEQLL